MTQARIKVKERVYRERITRVKVEESVAGEGAFGGAGYPRPNVGGTGHPVMWCCGW
jgi:hypothetical protein